MFFIQMNAVYSPRLEGEAVAQLPVGDGGSEMIVNISPAASFFTRVSEPDRLTGLQMPSSSSWACCLRNATYHDKQSPQGLKRPGHLTLYVIKVPRGI